MKIKATIDGEELEFELLNHGRTDDVTHYISVQGHISVIAHDFELSTHLTPLRLIRETYVFGGVVFEKTGETRKAKADEWVLQYLLDAIRATPTFVTSNETCQEYAILHPVALED